MKPSERCAMLAAPMERSLPIYASTATRRARRRGWSRRRRGWLRVLRPGLLGALTTALVLLALTAERALG